MSVAKMKLVSLTGTMEHLDQTISRCLDGDDFQIEHTSTFLPGNTDFIPLEDENPFTAPYGKLSEAVTVARLKLPQKPGFSQMSNEQIAEYADSLSSRLLALAGSIDSLTREAEQLGQNIEQFEHFKGLDMHLQDIFSCEFIKVRFGRMPKEYQPKLNQFTDNPYVTMFPCSTDHEYVWGVYFTPIEAAAEVDRIFQSLYWERLRIPDAAGTPEEAVRALEERLGSLTAELEAAKNELAALWEQERSRCGMVLTTLDRNRLAFDLRKHVARYHESDIFFFVGWVPLKEVDDFVTRFGDIPSVECEVVDPKLRGDRLPPVKLYNWSVFKPFEMFVRMYGLPGYREIDPTPFVAVTYFLLFGMMFADLGQGLLLVVGGWLYWKKTKSALAQIVAMCGVSSAIFGAVLGSVFGYETWLNPLWGYLGPKMGLSLDEGKPINIDNPAMVLRLIYAAIGFGAVLLMLAMTLNIYTKLKQRMLGDALLSHNGLAGLVFYGSVFAAVIGNFIFRVNLMSTWYVICLMVLPLAVVFFQEPLGRLIEGKPHWLPENIGEYLIETIFEFFEIVLSYASNTLSFLRVGAFVVIHYGMMTAVFVLAGDNPRTFGYIFTVIVGNLLVMGIEALFAGIQALRLEFYELFSRFFIGSGTAFRSMKNNRQLSK